jgi:hypothetical protein
MMKEAFLHFAWKTQSFTTFKLFTTRGEKLQVILPGEHNSNVGPDFLQAKIKIGSTTWMGSVEIHIRASDWIRHKHHLDQQYENTILHVVYINDAEIKRIDGTTIPQLEIAELLPPQVLHRFNKIVNDNAAIPCENVLPKTFIWSKSLFEELIHERLVSKSTDILYRLNELNGDWLQLLYEYIADALGKTINSEALLSLTRRVPFKLLNKFSDRIDIIEAMLFGTAGFLNGNKLDSYSQKLTQNYTLRSYQFKLDEMPFTYWKYFRLRPSSFPERRIAQLAALVTNIPQIWVGAKQGIEPLKKSLNIGMTDYWKQHYKLGIRNSSAHITIKVPWPQLVINAIAPILYSYGLHLQKDSYVDSALSILVNIKPENSKVTRMFKKLNFYSKSALQSQAQVHLFKSYCSAQRCLNCPVWLSGISTDGDSSVG